MSSRAVLKGFIKFNLVTIPVGIYTATVGQVGVALNQLHKDCGQRIRHRKTCPVHGDVEQHEIVSGYQFAKDQYVIVDDAEKRAAKPKQERAVTIAGFIKPDCVDLCHYTDGHYYLLPDGEVGRKPYALLRQAMVDAKRHALARIVFQSREYVAIIRPMENVLMLSLLAYAHELKDRSEFTDAAPRVVLQANELKMAKLLTEAMTIEDPELGQYRDGYADRLLEVIEAKVKGQQTVESRHEPAGDRVINLMDALEQSLKRARTEKPAKRRKAS